TREQQTRAMRISRSHQYPALPVVERSVLDQFKTENADEVLQGFVIIPNYKSDVTDCLGHEVCLLSRYLCYSARSHAARAGSTQASRMCFISSRCARLW